MLVPGAEILGGSSYLHTTVQFYIKNNFCWLLLL